MEVGRIPPPPQHDCPRNVVVQVFGSNPPPPKHDCPKKVVIFSLVILSVVILSVGYFVQWLLCPWLLYPWLFCPVVILSVVISCGYFVFGYFVQQPEREKDQHAIFSTWWNSKWAAGHTGWSSSSEQLGTNSPEPLFAGIAPAKIGPVGVASGTPSYFRSFFSSFGLRSL